MTGKPGQSATTPGFLTQNKMCSVVYSSADVTDKLYNWTTPSAKHFQSFSCSGNIQSDAHVSVVPSSRG